MRVRTMRKRNAVRGERLKGKVGVLRLSTTGARTFQSAATFETAALATFLNSANRSAAADWKVRAPAVV